MKTALTGGKKLLGDVNASRGVSSEGGAPEGYLPISPVPQKLCQVSSMDSKQLVKKVFKLFLTIGKMDLSLL